jgi:hypothetical protein
VPLFLFTTLVTTAHGLVRTNGALPVSHSHLGHALRRMCKSRGNHYGLPLGVAPAWLAVQLNAQISLAHLELAEAVCDIVDERSYFTSSQDRRS